MTNLPHISSSSPQSLFSTPFLLSQFQKVRPVIQYSMVTVLTIFVSQQLIVHVFKPLLCRAWRWIYASENSPSVEKVIRASTPTLPSNVPISLTPVRSPSKIRKPLCSPNRATVQITFLELRDAKKSDSEKQKRLLERTFEIQSLRDAPTFHNLLENTLEKPSHESMSSLSNPSEIITKENIGELFAKYVDCKEYSLYVYRLEAFENFTLVSKSIKPPHSDIHGNGCHIIHLLIEKNGQMSALIPKCF